MCYLLLAKNHPIFETENNKLDIEVYKFDEKMQKKSETPSLVYEWTHKMRMTANNKNYNHFIDFFLVGSQIQLGHWFFMEEYIVLRFYGSTVEPCKLPMHVIEMVFALEYVEKMESVDELFSG